MLPTERIRWVDTARGLSMLAILLFHTEKYYAGEEIIPYAYYVCNALIVFFFVSGYLIIPPKKPFSLPRKLKSIVRGIVIPYFVFTAVIALPKALVHDDTTIQETFLRILTGHASWFIAALIVGELLFSFLYHVTHGKLIPLMTVCLLPYPIIAVLYHFFNLETLWSINIWCWQNAFMMLIFIFLGHLYHRKEQQLSFTHQPYTIIIAGILLLLLKFWESKSNFLFTLQPIHVSSFLILIIDGLLGILFIVGICRHLPDIKPIQWTGAHSLVYYFICGGVPFIVCTLLGKAGYPYDGRYYLVIIAFLLVYVLSTIITWLIYHYILNFYFKRIK